MVLLISSVWDKLTYLSLLSFRGYKNLKPCCAFRWVVMIQTLFLKHAEQALLPMEPFYNIRARCQLCIYMHIACSFWKKLQEKSGYYFVEQENLIVILHQSMKGHWTAKKGREQCSHGDRNPVWTHPQTALLIHSTIFLQANLSHVPEKTIVDSLIKILKNTNNNGKFNFLAEKPIIFNTIYSDFYSAYSSPPQLFPDPPQITTHQTPFFFSLNRVKTGI